MKKLFFICLMFFTWSAYAFTPPSPGPQLSYRFANPRIVRVSGFETLQFDVQIKCDQVGGLYLWTSEVHLYFNNSAFSNTSTNWSVVTKGDFSGPNSSGSNLKYTVTRTATDTPLMYNIGLTGDVSVASNGPSSDDFGLVTNDWTTMVTVSARLIDTSGNALAGIDFRETPMNGNQQYIASGGATPVYSDFFSPNLYDSRDFLTAYTGRFYSTGTNDWSQIGGLTNNVKYLNWATPVGTTVWDGNATMPAGVANATALQIQNPATLTIPPTGQVTVTGTPGTLEIGTPAGGLTIQSDATGTGSLITNLITPGSGTAISNIYMKANQWHLVSSPVTQPIGTYLSTNVNIPLSASNRGMMDYNPTTNHWNSYFTSGTSGFDVGAGKGFCLRTDADGNVISTGPLQYATESLSGLTAGWNCIGNPLSSAIKMNTSSDAVNNFLSINAGTIDAASGIYIWDGATSNYLAYSNASGAYNLPQGQAFMVKYASGTISFTEAMQIHTPSTPYIKSTRSIWPTIKLNATINNLQNSTVIAYNSGMTKGLDPTYDAVVFKAESDLLIYTKLVNDIGSPFAIQALPDNNYNGMIIPVGIDSKTGGEVVFSAETFDLPSSAKVILEDKVAGKFTDLSTASYKALIAPNSSVGDRFFIHNSMSTVSALGGQNSNSKLNAFAYQNVEIRIVGEVTGEAVATLYDVTGKAVIIQKLTEGQLNVIPVTSVSSGLYLLSVRDGANSQTFKIILKDQ